MTKQQRAEYRDCALWGELMGYSFYPLYYWLIAYAPNDVTPDMFKEYP